MTRITGHQYDLVISNDTDAVTVHEQPGQAVCFYIMERGKEPGIDTPETFWPARNDPQQIRTALQEALDSWTFYEGMR